MICHTKLLKNRQSVISYFILALFLLRLSALAYVYFSCSDDYSPPPPPIMVSQPDTQDLSSL